MRNKIKNVMALVFEIEPSQIPDSSSTSTIDNWDSLNHMNLVVALEEEFNIQFNDDEIIEIISLDAIEKSLLSKNIIL
jgi:acyl carrier protein